MNENCGGQGQKAFAAINEVFQAQIGKEE